MRKIQNLPDDEMAFEPNFDHLPKKREHRVCVEASEKRLGRLAQVLRVVGAAAFAVAVSTFLVQRWGESSDVYRYLCLLGCTLLLPSLAYLCGITMRENRSARLVFGLLLSVIPMHAGVLGGLLLSQFSWWAPEALATPYIMWVASSPFAAIATSCLAMAVLLPLSYLGFLTLARPHATKLTLLFAACNLAILIPLRSAYFATPLAVLMCSGWFFMERRWFVQNPAMSTWEGIWARLVLLLPAVLVLVRQTQLYSATPIVSGILCGLGSAFLLSVSRMVAGKATTWLERIAIVPTVMAWTFWAIALGDILPFEEEHLLVAIGILCGASFVALSRVVRGARYAYENAGAIAAAVPLAIAMLIEPSGWVSLACLVLGIGFLSIGYLKHRHILMSSGAIAIVTGFGYHAIYAIKHFAIAGWLGLALVGAAAIVAASLAERRASKRAPRIASQTNPESVEVQTASAHTGAF